VKHAVVEVQQPFNGPFDEQKERPQVERDPLHTVLDPFADWQAREVIGFN
jgi:hypothetical protein